MLAEASSHLVNRCPVPEYVAQARLNWAASLVGVYVVIDALLRWFVKSVLWLRYRVRVGGVEAVREKGTCGILFLPNHPALIDPIIVMSQLHRDFRPRALADADQIDRFFIRRLARRAGVRPLPDIRKRGLDVRDEVAAAVAGCLEALRAGENVLLYPSGHLYRTHLEDLRGNSAVERILRELPDVRVVLVRTGGLWGSSYSLAGGQVPSVKRNVRRQLWVLLKNFLFFTPRRDVTIELWEPEDLPREADRQKLNRFIERYYNEDAPPNTYVPYTIWEGGGRQTLPDPTWGHMEGQPADVPETTRKLVRGYLQELTGASSLQDGDRLSHDLGLDSLAKTELVLWLNREFGFGEADVDALQTVGDVMLAARGEAVVTRPVEITPPGKGWWRAEEGEVWMPAGETITEVFLRQAARRGGKVVIADQRSGSRTYRDLITGIFALLPTVRGLLGERVGIMLPASVGAVVVYLATMFARKTPVMVNWTTGMRNVEHSMDLLGVERILTARALAGRLRSQGLDLGRIESRLVYLEDVGAQLSRRAKLGAWMRTRLSWGALRRVKPSEMAAILLTSGSEALPKAVPLTHQNILTNIRDVLKVARLRGDDCLIGFLPPFHSFGLTVTVLTPLLAGLRAVYHANPTEAWVLGRLIESYGVTAVCGTPTFLSGIARSVESEKLRSLRLVVTGAEKCPERTYALLESRCPQAKVVEGYGVTECSPIVSVNRPDAPQRGTIGRVVPSLEYALVDVDNGEPVKPGATGMLLVRGPSVFSGYLGEEVESPFVEHEGRTWYQTGDLVSEDADGVLTFRGRLKRFVKLGGEMISLPAVEAVLSQRWGSEADEGPAVAVEAGGGEDHPELVLFTTRDLKREDVNRALRDAGLSALHNISRVEQVDEIPLAGTGKTDYRRLRERLTAD